jgi:hypothetical protein
MSALGDVATGAGGVLAGQLWKVATLVLLAILLARRRRWRRTMVVGDSGARQGAD